MGEEKAELVGILLAENESDRKDAEEKFFKVRERGRVWRKEKKRKELGLALLTRLMASSVQREGARWSWWSRSLIREGNVIRGFVGGG